jgi:ankyrin repeat protein
MAIEGIETQLDKCALHVGNLELTPIEVLSPAKHACLSGTNRFWVNENKIEHILPNGTNVDWTASVEDGLSVNWLGADAQVAYLDCYKTNREGRLDSYESPFRVRRLNLSTGKWLSDLPIKKGTPSGYTCQNVVGLLTSDGGAIVLTALVKESHAKSEEDSTDAYGLGFFRGELGSPTWSKLFPAAGQRPYTGGYLWGVPGPRYAGSGLKPLSWMGSRLLVGAEAMQPIYCLNPDTGSEIWKVDRLWEFQRGFIGPSVWSHYISRFGTEEFDQNKKSPADLRKAFDQQYRCALAGGPAPVALGFERGNDSHSVFVAAVKGPAREYAGYLSDCLLYELGDDGKPVSMLTLPQAVDGSEFCIHDGGVVWKCQNDMFVKINPSRHAAQLGMGPGGPDCLSELAWARRVQYTEPKAWFVSGKAGEPVAFGENYAFCIPAGGYVLRRGDTIYRFPIAAVSLSTGLDVTFELDVPFTGTFALPTSNFSQVGGPSGSTRSINWHLLAISDLAAYGNELDVTLAGEKQTCLARFDLKTVSITKESSAARPDRMSAARERAKLVEKGSLNEALEEAANGADAAYVKALLDAGADPKYASPLGWTALMVASVYGTAEMVDILVAAGSDVNAADKNCCGQTVFIWAAKSGREAKRKVQALLNAGATPKRTDELGFDALMYTAQEGDLETVELLLKSGLSVTNRSLKGETALMLGSRGGSAQVVSALVKAGANVNAKDSKGMTPLMHAAEGVNSAEAADTLLKAGADPDAKDNEGRTALQIVQRSQMFGAEQVRQVLQSATRAK